MNLHIINGPNLNLLGIREKNIYGEQSFELFFKTLQTDFPKVNLHYFQSNHEGMLIDQLHAIGFSATGIILNAGAYTHTSVAIADAIAAIQTPVLEVHISNVFARESFRHHSFISKNCVGGIFGLGLSGYRLAIEYFMAEL
ncbi:MAG: type II 3-dehydroquinate dehydratase [Verrucomicrobia bacterium]|nr:type II 3-dehydroquinate dehydratase [Cytophagales bacterium]